MCLAFASNSINLTVTKENSHFSTLQSMRSTLSMPCLIGLKHAVYSVDAMLDWFASADQSPVNMFTRTNIFR